MCPTSHSHVHHFNKCLCSRIQGLKSDLLILINRSINTYLMQWRMRRMVVHVSRHWRRLDWLGIAITMWGWVLISIGWRLEIKEGIACKLLLRFHTEIITTFLLNRYIMTRSRRIKGRGNKRKQDNDSEPSGREIKLSKVMAHHCL